MARDHVRVFALVLGLAACASDNRTNPKPAPAHSIGVRVVAGRGELYDRTTSARFTARGVNYIRLAVQLDTDGNPFLYHSTFNVGLYDAPRAEALLARMAQDGYNTVRVFLNGCCAIGTIGDPNGGLSAAYVANLADFLVRAKAHGVYAIITTDRVPSYGGYADTLNAACCTPFDAENLDVLTGAGAFANGHFFRDVATALNAQHAPTEAILGFELRNELYFNSTAAPFTQTSGMVKAGNGSSYDMASAGDRQRMMDEGLAWWTTSVRTEIVAVDPDALVTVGFFQPQGPNPTRIGDYRLIEPYPGIAVSTADFVDLHAYTGYELSIDQYAQNYGEESYLAKPVIIGEFGSVKSTYPTIAQGAQSLVAWQTGSCPHGFSGWLLWSWDEYEPDFPFWTMTSGDSSVERALAPVQRADPCAP